MKSQTPTLYSPQSMFARLNGINTAPQPWQAPEAQPTGLRNASTGMPPVSSCPCAVRTHRNGLDG